MTAERLLLVLDTATRTPTLALAEEDGTLIGQRQWQSQHRHGEELLERLDGLLSDAGVGRRDIGGVAVGTGPGSFTGLRIGLATAKTIAYSLDVPLVGLSTTRALAIAVLADALSPSASHVAVTLPAGVADRYVHRLQSDGQNVVEVEPPRLVAGDSAFTDAAGEALLVAVDLAAPDVPPDSVERGQRALAGLAAALAREGATALAAGKSDDVARLVPAYVALPRGIQQAADKVEWSPDLR